MFLWSASICMLGLLSLCALARTVVLVFCFFFFQAEDGIRDVAVTGVQTCALPIFTGGIRRAPADPLTGSGRYSLLDDASWFSPRNSRLSILGQRLVVALRVEAEVRILTPARQSAAPAPGWPR